MTVTKGAFEGIYKHQGYAIVNDYSGTSKIKTEVTSEEVAKSFIDDVASVEAQLPESGETEESSEKSFEMAELLEVPIGQWSKEQLKEFAEANNISIDGASTVREVRNIIKDFIDSAK